MKVLIIGGGGREHAIAQKLLQEGHEVFAAPGNPGIAKSGGRLASLDIKDFKTVADFVESNGIDFTVVGPEAPLAAGIVDYFNARNLPIFGPTKAAAEIETSKIFCQSLLEKVRVPVPRTSRHDNFGNMWQVTRGTPTPFVIKYDGLAAGKGVEVVHEYKDRQLANQRLSKLADGPYVIQEFVQSPELSFFELTDGVDFLFLGSAQDYKPLYKGGPNTGGMGGFSPHPLLTPELRQQIEETIVRPTIKAMAEFGCPYRGVMYFQLMLTKRGPVVIEINCRFGDPEAQLILPLLNCELLPLLQATTKSGFLRMFEAQFKPGVAVGIVMASEGYPDDPKTGRVITGLDTEFSDAPALVFHAGTKYNAADEIVTSGGRVLTVVGLWSEYRQAKSLAMKRVGYIHFEGEYHREDIADEVLKVID